MFFAGGLMIVSSSCVKDGLWMGKRWPDEQTIFFFLENSELEPNIKQWVTTQSQEEEAEEDVEEIEADVEAPVEPVAAVFHSSFF
jgi:hypothetical protein